MSNKHKGSSFDDFLEKENLLEVVEATAIKKIIAYELQRQIERQKLSKTKVAIKLHTSRTALERLLDPNNTAITLHTLVKVAHFLGKKLRLSFAN